MLEYNDDMERLRELVIEKSFRYGYFTLSSGMESLYYFDGRLTTLWPEGAQLVGKKVFELVKDAGCDAIGGPTLGADAMVAAAALVSHQEGQPIPAFIVRKEAKKHGAQRHVEGHLPEAGTVAIVDDVITTGKSIFRAVEVVESAGCRVGKVIVLLDRNQGGSEEIRKRGYNFAAILSADEKGNVTFG
ncbi:MAG: orotate phosphoribosyltransferase [Chloroflexi bacterium]|jgi:orotate phosphoribosyltransferase|nr:orotate phosphoribosyltransferase [Chloroflexota bacterium]